MHAHRLVQDVLTDVQHPRLAERMVQFLQTAPADDPRRPRIGELLQRARERREKARR